MIDIIEMKDNAALLMNQLSTVYSEHKVMIVALTGIKREIENVKYNSTGSPLGDLNELRRKISTAIEYAENIVGEFEVKK